MAALLDDMLHNLYQRLRQFARIPIGRLLGTVSAENGAYKFMVDLGERSLFVRAESNAIVGLLIKKGVISAEEWQISMSDELTIALDEQGKKWPEVTVNSDGSGYTVDVKAWAERCKREGWPP